MIRKDDLKTALVCLASLLAIHPVKAQTIEGHISSSGEYPIPPVVNALVSAAELGEDHTNSEGYYHIPPLSVPPVSPCPGAGTQLQFPSSLYNVLGQRVGRLKENQTLESFLNNNRDLASGKYFLMINNEFGKSIQPLLKINSDFIIGNKKDIMKYEKKGPVLDNFKDKNRNVNTLYIYYVDDDLVEGDIGEFYNFVDTLNIGDSTLVKDVRLIERFYIGSEYYDELLDLILDLEDTYVGLPTYTITNYGDYPDCPDNPFAGYPLKVWLNEEQAYQLCLNPETYINTERAALDSLNTKTGLNIVVEEADSTEANIKVKYTATGNSNWYPNWQQYMGNYYLAGGTVYLRNVLPGFVNIYREFCHELGIHGLGMEGHSDDPNYISYGQALQTLDFQQEEIEAIRNHVLQYPWYVTGDGYLLKFIEE